MILSSSDGTHRNVRKIRRRFSKISIRKHKVTDVQLVDLQMVMLELREYEQSCAGCTHVEGTPRNGARILK